MHAQYNKIFMDMQIHCAEGSEETIGQLNLLIEENEMLSSAGIPEPLQTVFTILKVSAIQANNSYNVN